MISIYCVDLSVNMNAYGTCGHAAMGPTKEKEMRKSKNRPSSSTQKIRGFLQVNGETELLFHGIFELCYC